MTREEAFKEHREIDKMNKWFNYDLQLLGLIEKIYDDFESRTCGNCLYYIYCSRENGKTKQAMPYFRCSNEDIDADGGWFEPPNKNFGCNKFERKDND